MKILIYFNFVYTHTYTHIIARVLFQYRCTWNRWEDKDIASCHRK